MMSGPGTYCLFSCEAYRVAMTKAISSDINDVG